MGKITVGERKNILQKDVKPSQTELKNDAFLEEKAKATNSDLDDIYLDDEVIDDEVIDEDDVDNYLDDDDEDVEEMEEYKNQFSNTTTTEFESKIEVPSSSSFSLSIEELKEFIFNTAGSFYATYVSHFHPSQLAKGGDSIRRDAAKEIIAFSKILLEELSKEMRNKK
uniref:Uncharacterized protein n=1 Tax=Dictyoglomus turgidum TaxID=513050 RepID=A0A7C3WRQ9_9BACT